MKNLYLLLFFLFLILSTENTICQVSRFDEPSYATFTPLSTEEIMQPLLIMQQRHNQMANNIINAIKYIEDLKKQTTENKFLNAMDLYLSSLESMQNTLEEKGVNFVSTNLLKDIYKGINNEIDSYNERIELQKELQNKLTEYVKGASEAMNNNEYSLAVEYLNKAINIDPYNSDNKQHYRNRGICYLFGLFKPKEALLDFTNYYNLCESNSTEQAQAFYFIGNCYEMNSEFIFAYEYYSKCIKIDNSFLNAYYRRGIVTENPQESITDYDYIINFNGATRNSFKDMATVFNNKAYCLYKLGKSDLALIYVNKALELDEKLAYIWDTRGEIYYQKGMYSKCILDMNKAISIQAESANSYYLRGLANIKMKYLTKGCKDLNIANELGHLNAIKMLNKYCK